MHLLTTAAGRPRWSRTVTTSLLLAVAYFLTGWLGLRLSSVDTAVTLLWLPSGIAVAGLMRWGVGCWPGTWLGAFALGILLRTPWPVAIGLAAGNTLGPLAVVWVLRRLGLHATFDRTRDILLLAAAATAGTLVSATLGIGSLALGGLRPSGRLATWLTWWAGDAMGVIAVAPLLLAVTRKEVRVIARRRGEFALWLGLTLLVTWAVFVLNPGRPDMRWSLAFVPLPLVAWAALRFGPIGTSLALIAISVGAAYGTASGQGPFARQNSGEGVAILWWYMVSSAMLGWLITAVHTARVNASAIQQLLERALGDVSLGVLVTGVDRRITYANEGFTRLTGYAERELLGESCALLQGAETDQETVVRIRTALAGDGYFDGEILNYRKDGSTFWNALLISPVRDERGEMTGFLGVQRDVSAGKAAEAALRESEEHLRTIVELEPECVKLLSPDGRLLEMNPAGLAMIEAATFDEVRNIPIAELIFPEDRAAFAGMHARVMRGETARCEFSIIGLRGTHRWMETHAVPYLNGRREIIGALGITRDISDQKHAEVALRASEERYRTLALFAPVGIFRADRKGNCLYVNDRWCDLAGMPAERAMGTGWAAALHADDRERVFAEWNAAARDGVAFSSEYRFRNAEGRVTWLQGAAVPSPDANGVITEYLGSVTDLTERKQAEEERRQLDAHLQHAHKLESLGVLAGGIAHDFNNLLTSVLGNASIAASELPPSSPVQENITEIAEASLRAADLCKQMLAYSGRGRFVVQTLDLGQLVEQTARMLRLSIGKSVTLHFQIEAGVPPVEVDATQVRQVIMNLVINASEAIGDASGVIRLTTGLVRVDRSDLAGTLTESSLREGDYVYLEVADNGSGMSAETQARMFDPFFTTKFTGRGLGLAAALGIMRGHNGAMKVQSEVGRGATFTVLLPPATGGKEESAAAPGSPAAWRGEGIVLVVDDEESMRATVSRMVSRHGLEPVLAADGVEAVELFRDNPDRYALVLLDLTMPRMDGEQIFTALRQVRPDVPVVLMSGYDAQEAMGRFTGRRLSGFLQKPFTLAQMRAVLRSVLG